MRYFRAFATRFHDYMAVVLEAIVITANYGRLRGRRIVRGREDECAGYYENAKSNSPAPEAARQRKLFADEAATE